MNAILKGKAKTETVSAAELSIGEEMQKKARAFGVLHSAELGDTINRVAKAKQDYQGGPFAVMFKVTANMTGEQVDELPHPSSNTGNNPAVYKLPGNGPKAKPVEGKYYNTVSDSLACNVAKQQRIEILELSLGDPTKVNMSSVPQDILDMHKDYRDTEIARLKGELATSRKAVNEAFELLFHIREVNELAGVTASVIYALDKDGKSLDGEDGRETVVENTTTPIIVTTTNENRKGIDTIKLPVASFKRLNPAKAKEAGETFKALMDTATVKRGTKTPAADAPGGAKPFLINTIETFQARTTDYHDYIDKVWSATDKAEYQKLLAIVGPRGPAGSDDFALSLYSIYTCLGDLYRHDTIRARAEALKEADAVAPVTKAA